MPTHKVTAAVQADIKKALDSMPEEGRPTIKRVSAAFRNTGNVADAISKATTVTDDSAPAGTVGDSTNKSDQPAPVAAAAPAKPAKSLPDAPAGWEPCYASTGFRRYTRRLKANGQPVSSYSTPDAKSAEEKAIVQHFADQGVEGRFIVHNHTTGATLAFETWADAYAFSCTMFSPGLAPSVVSSIGGDPGLTRLSNRVGMELSKRIQAIIDDDEKAEEEESAAASA